MYNVHIYGVVTRVLYNWVSHTGGKVLARYETPAESFLFPESPGLARPREVKTVVLSKSRVYKVRNSKFRVYKIQPEAPLHLHTITSSLSHTQHSPHLTLTTSTTLTKVTTPFGTPIPPRPPVGGPGEFSKPSNTAKHDLKSTAHKTGREETAQDKLHLLLSSYTTEPHPLQDQESGEGGLERELKLKRPHGRIKLKPPVPKFTSTKRSLSNQQGAKFSTGNPTQNHRVRGRGPLSSTTTDLYHCCTAFLGPHCWTACPRRSFRKHSAGQQPRPRSKSVPSPKLRGKYIQQRRLRYAPGHHHASLDDLNVAPLASSGKGVVNLCRPFVAGKADVSVLARRNFCGQNPKIVQRHFIAESPSGGGRAQTREGRECGFQGALFGVRERESPAEREETRFAVPHTQRGAAHSSPLQSRARRETGESLVDPALSQRYLAGTDDKLEGDKDSCTTASVSEEGTGGMGSQEGGGSSNGSQEGGGSSDGSSPDTLASGETSDASCESHSPQARPNSQPSVTSRRLVSGRHRELLSKYVQYEYGNGGTGTGTPARLIENKLNTLINECCECRVSHRMILYIVTRYYI